MSSESQEFKVGDSILIVGTDHDGELGTILRISDDPGNPRYLVVFETGDQMVFSAENLSHRR